jgi:YD repeat-containing protein
MPGRGPSPTVARAYNSLDDRVGPLGPGWTHSAAIRLHTPGTGSCAGTLVLVGPSGRTDCYSGAGPTYTPPVGVDTTLVKNGDGTFAATHQDQRRWEFDVQGRLTAIVDRVGNTATLTYDAGTGRLTGIADPAGRGSLTLSYDGNGRLWKVSDWLTPTARVVEYQYEGSNQDVGRLLKVVDREGKITQFGYSGTSHRLTAITDANGHVAVTNTYDAQGRVATQKDARGLTTGQQTTLSYVTNGDGTKTTTVTLPATSHEPGWNPAVIDTYDTSGRLTTRVTKPTAASAEWVTETYAYDAANNRTSLTDGRGNTTNYCYDVDYAGATISGGARHLTRRIEPAPAAGQARPVTLFQYDANTPDLDVPPKGVASGPTAACTTDFSAARSALPTDLTHDASQTKLLSVARQYTDPTWAADGDDEFEYGDAANPGLGQGHPRAATPALAPTTPSPQPGLRCAATKRACSRARPTRWGTKRPSPTMRSAGG